MGFLAAGLTFTVAEALAPAPALPAALPFIFIIIVLTFLLWW
jgi:hypothetical protein